MKKRIILHVGSPKCGSTYLQQVFLKNTATLNAAGMSYPAPAKGHPGNGLAILDANPAAMDKWFADGIHTVIFSHEDLYATPTRGAALAALAKERGIDLQVVVFLRPFSEFIYGDYSQFMKQNFHQYLRSRQPYGGHSFDEFVQQRSQVLKPVVFLDGWQSQSSHPIRIAKHRDIQTTIEDLLGTEAIATWKISHGLTNPSLRMEDCDTLVEMMRDDSQEDKAILKAFKASFAPNNATDLGRTVERSQYIERVFGPQTEALLTRFGFDNRPAPEA